MRITKLEKVPERKLAKAIPHSPMPVGLCRPKKILHEKTVPAAWSLKNDTRDKTEEICLFRQIIIILKYLCKMPLAHHVQL